MERRNNIQDQKRQQQLATKTQPKSAPQKVTPQVIQYRPRTRLREKTTPPTFQDTSAPHTTKGAAGQGLPHPSEAHHGGDYWYREGPYWKRVHVEPRTAFYIPEQTHDGPDIKRLIPWRQTKVQPVGGERQHARLKMNGQHSQQRHQTSLGQAGQTLRNIRSSQHSSSQMMKNNNKAQEQKQYRRPSNLHRSRFWSTMSHRSWCPICVQARGRQNNHPKQHSKLPIIQLSNYTARLRLHQRLR